MPNEKWKLEKRLQRESMSSQAKRRLNEKRRAQYALQKNSKKHEGPHSLPTQAHNTSDSARRKAVSRTFKILPKDPNKFADVLSSVVKSATPTRKSALRKKIILSPSQKKATRFSQQKLYQGCHT